MSPYLTLPPPPAHLASFTNKNLWRTAANKRSKRERLEAVAIIRTFFPFLITRAILGPSVAGEQSGLVSPATRVIAVAPRSPLAFLSLGNGFASIHFHRVPFPFSSQPSLASLASTFFLPLFKLASYLGSSNRLNCSIFEKVSQPM